MHPLIRTILQRIALGGVALFAVSVVVFSALEFLPGDFATSVLGRNATPETVEAFRDELGLNLPPAERYLVVGVVVTEVVFVYPGIGQTMVDAVRNRDIPVVQACTLIFAATYILLNLLADIISIATSPRLLHAK